MALKAPDSIDLEAAPLDDSIREELRHEAASRQRAADLIAIEDFSLDDDGALRGKRHVSASGPGPVLTKLHHGAGLALARKGTLLPSAIFPTRASYLYYAPGDFVLLHHDVTQCTATILASLSDSTDPLIAYPSFGAATHSDIPHLNEAPFESRLHFDNFMSERLSAERMTSAPLDIRSDSMLVLPGRDLLHARYPQATPVSMVALCYSALVHRPAWSK